jgi:hypothetical protein
VIYEGISRQIIYQFRVLITVCGIVAKTQLTDCKMKIENCVPITVCGIEAKSVFSFSQFAVRKTHLEKNCNKL